MSFLERLARAFVRLCVGTTKLVLLVILLGVAGALSAWFTMRYVIVGEEVVVPKAIGLPLGEARERLARQGLYLTERSSRFDESTRENVVLEQDPAPGHRLKVNKRVYVVVSRGTRRLAVPDLVGLTLAQARIRITEEGLELGSVVLARNNHVVEGAVAALDPPPGSEYFKDSPLTLLVSSGSEEVAFVMPDLIGRNVDDVLAFLQQAGLRLGDIREEDYEGLDSGTITHQEPDAGSRVAARDIIALRVVRGAFPDEEEDGSVLPLSPS